ncbi:hypothetical protein CAEBREN_30610 [Caenorhabditis brenneri]|uniref:Uncharacterized protein n=1 Tax=Caenorhabditis brenneri TaxID=135651 RepID=G0MWE3_CAEBE|nr:hypothetical protein CAEBREN_30610 [Caenorhabditis brenneri]
MHKEGEKRHEVGDHDSDELDLEFLITKRSLHSQLSWFYSQHAKIGCKRVYANRIDRWLLLVQV